MPPPRRTDLESHVGESEHVTWRHAQRHKDAPSLHCNRRRRHRLEKRKGALGPSLGKPESVKDHSQDVRHMTLTPQGEHKPDLRLKQPEPSPPEPAGIDRIYERSR